MSEFGAGGASDVAINVTNNVTASGISADAGQVLAEGVDGGAYLSGAGIVAAVDAQLGSTVWQLGGAGGGALPTDLSFDAASRLLSSSTGADVTLPLVGADAGLMSGADKAKLDAVPAGFAAVAVSGAYGDLSGVPAIPSAPGDIGAASAVHSHTVAQITDFPAIPSAPEDIGAADRMLVVDVAGAAYAISSADMERTIRTTNAAAVALTIPAGIGASGDFVNIVRDGDGAVSVAGTGGAVVVTRTDKLATVEPVRGVASLMWLAADRWLLVGDLAAAP